MVDIYYLFFGIASEYVLNPLYRYMCEKGFSCIEIDLLHTSNVREILKSLKGKPIVFITSAHLFLDSYNLSTIQQHNVEIFSPLEIMDYLRPIKNFIVPHDLTTLFHDQDMHWLDLFDCLLIPLPCPAYLLPYPHVINVGWIKRAKPVLPVAEEEHPKIGFALSNFTTYIELGPKKTYKIWEPILKQGVTIKFPDWYQDKEYEQYFLQQGASVFPSKKDISEFIDLHNIIICNTFSSVNSEVAFSGRQVINILEPETAVMQKEKLNVLPNIRFMTFEESVRYISQANKKNISLKLVPPQIKPFDFELTTKVITNQVE